MSQDSNFEEITFCIAPASSLLASCMTDRYHHPHIVQVLGVCEELNAMVMERLQGSLYQHLHQVHVRKVL